jgi:hypothetical protein
MQCTEAESWAGAECIEWDCGGAEWWNVVYWSRGVGWSVANPAVKPKLCPSCDLE